MTDREKIIEIIAPFISAYGEDEAIADALIDAGIRDITREGYICMNGEVIVPTPNIYNKVADLLDCPKIKEREIEEEKGE